ncbi:lipid A biosynthesis lauroyl acyltransferase [Atopomonas sediminilitoris]|uniref:lipid A biosynthesis lauroyl acyltransferase n=1 Tax=Atopomonas sediminilitoris TaxID=2919919 RepID=UPI001F4DA05D|nr:lipid A biosynthesis lauroyl acyltransferase [Atopomonas sediminilitoris]MCJ8170083.1 lipid A biosynthesis lauroyl acyltransferase [Atopomonas sediminilitoris]
MDRPQFRAYFLHPRFWLLWLGLGVLWLVAQLPYPLLLRFGRALGWLMYRVASSRRDIVECNLQLCFPHLSAREREQLAKENFASTGITFFEMAISWWWPAARLRRLGQVEGLEHLQQAAADGQGVILMALHFTTLEMGGGLLGLEHGAYGMYRPHKNPLFDYVQRRGREQRLLGVIGRDDLRGMLRLLRAGDVVWYAPDQDYGAQNSVFVPLYGVQAATVTATSKFARLGRAKVIPFTQQRLADGQGYRVVVHPPLDNFPGASEEEDCLRINQWIEQAINQHPEQYLWAHRRFKTRPQGEARPYRKSSKKRR